MSLSLFLAATVSAQTLTITVSPKATGTFTEALSTSFQTAPWTDPIFLAHPEIPTLLNQLNPHHINVQVTDGSIPQTAPGAWDFTALDRQLQPILSAADHSPVLQLADAPAFLYRSPNLSKTRFVTPAFIAGYAAYCAGMVRHYNAPGAAHPIRYWGILNEPDYFHISPREYVALYNAAVPAMLAVDPTIKLIALELGGEPADERAYLPVFIHEVKAQVDILGVHFYATCDRYDSDQALFDNVTSVVEQLRYIQLQLQAFANLSGIPIWILENNVNADFVDDNGRSSCEPQRRFLEDARGSSAFFAAWRALEFSRYGQANAQALTHWVFFGDRQYGEFNTEDRPAHPQLAFWVDQWLGRYFPPEIPAQVLAVRNPDSAHIEVLAVKHADGKIIILVANHSVANPTDNNGHGMPRSVTLNLSAVGTFATATRLTMNAATDPLVGPKEETITPSPKMRLDLEGYGVILLALSR